MSIREEKKEASTVQESFRNMAKSAKVMNAETAHITFKELDHDPNVTAVMSVYNGVKPSHVVLEQLYEWAETFNPIVVRKIDELMNA